MILKRKIFSFASYKINRHLKKHIKVLNTILDVGANQGQFALMASEYFLQAKIYSFEPVPEAYSILINNISRRNDRIITFNKALGNTTGEIAFYKNKYSPVSSALTIDKLNNHPNYSQDIATKIIVPIDTLDSIFKNNEIIRPCLLKLDVQGFEKEVIKGAHETLSSVDYILIEMPFYKLYENQPLFNELNCLLNDSGFELFLPMDINYGTDNDIIEIDFLYKRI